ncbi:MAG: xanthine dehydrogenase family protein subunit M [Proteobacteria bacterium]|nr:xanthine dehydrogenase family protein subunit M [Pseudomonadota bacterium]MDA1356831.1 xanthine dehydrogenase family protein subunit M [Pseudomonadota bacterium]
MKPAQFLYRDPVTVAEALNLLAEHGEDARLLAGGQSLVPMLNFRLVQPAVIIDLNGIEELGNIQVTGDWFKIGSMARQAAVESHREIIRGWPLLVDALRHVAHPPIRNRGTIGGSLAHNDSAAELPAVMIALGARMILQSATAQRTVPAESFFVSPLETALAPDELLVAIEAPVPDSSAGWGFAEISRRHGDFALAAAAVQLIPGDTARAPGARIVVTGVAERPLRVSEAENILCEGAWSAARDKAIRAAVETAVEPFEDLHAPGWYRQQVAGVMAARACQDALMRGADFAAQRGKKPGAVA